MNKTGIGTRIFIVGAPRSGTTYLQQLLMMHFTVASFPETHFFAIAYPKNRGKRAFTWPALNVRGLTRKLASQLGVPYIPRYDIGLFARDYISPYLALLDNAARMEGEEAWLEKTPRHLHMLETIEAVEGAKIIHLVRPGEDTVASLFEATNRYRGSWGNRSRFSLMKGWTLDEVIERWNNDIEISLEAVGRENHYVVCYEDLIRNETEQIRKIEKFLRIGRRQTIKSAEETARKVICKHELWKTRNLERLQSTACKFEEMFTPDQQEYIRRRLNQTAYLALKKRLAESDDNASR